MTNSQLDRFNSIAPYYDKLAGAIFGRSIQRAQLHFLSEIPDGSTILILGGGTGWILRELFQRKPASKVTYIEASSAMIGQSKMQAQQFSRSIHFIHGTERSLRPDQKFHAVITNFYLDLFSETILRKVVQQVRSQLKQGGFWLVSDFVNDRKWWHRLLLWIMYRFFNSIARVEARVLPDWQSILKHHQLREEKTQVFYSGFIRSSVYRNDQNR
ncbi:MAG: class I SAM-dependent methyltransferase [Bacteroidota bacterium]